MGAAGQGMLVGVNECKAIDGQAQQVALAWTASAPRIAHVNGMSEGGEPLKAQQVVAGVGVRACETRAFTPDHPARPRPGVVRLSTEDRRYRSMSFFLTWSTFSMMSKS